MWCETKARSPRAMQNVLLSSAPQARIGSGAASGSRTAPGTCPRERRMISGSGRMSASRARRTESSVRVRIGRSWTQKRSAIGPSRSQRLAVGEGDRLVADVAGGHHQVEAGLGAEQVVKRRVRQQHAEIRVARRNRSGDGRIRPAPGDHDRPLRTLEQGPLGIAQHDQALRRLGVAAHDRERLVLAVLAAAQLGDRGLVVGPAGEVVAAEPLDGDDQAVPQRRGRRPDGIRFAVGDPGGELAAVAIEQPQPRPALGAGVRLRVEAAVGGVLVLAPAGGAELEARHRRQRPVVGDAGDDREAGAAVGAVRERVAEAPVGGIAELGQAVGAGRDVGTDLRARPPPLRALGDLEAGTAAGLDRLGQQARRPGPAAAPRPAAARRTRRARRPAPSASIRTPRSSLRMKPARSSEPASL